MGMLGDKMLAAGVVSKDDAERVHRQEVIEKEKKRKAEQHKLDVAEARLRELRLKDLATETATMFVKGHLLESIGIEKSRVVPLLKGERATIPELALMGSMVPQIVGILKSDLYQKAIEEHRDLLMKNPEFLKSMRHYL